ncbi:MAG: mandelate racemase/muconate lactonizing enzyme family protein [Acetobacteraceae bacterium]|nr:mandelate racemase/muconate lactonizing enzyme family protein [Acetobacteraceae bacterium]
MRITAVTTHILSSRFDYGNPAGPGGNLHLRDMDTLLVKVETDAGITGWGEGFGFTLVQTTRDAVDRLIAPICIGQDPRDIEGLSRLLQRRLHNFGRNGPVTFGISGVEIALWDIAGKAAGKPVHALLGGAKRERVPAYASLLRYGDPALTGKNTAEAIARGYRHIKLHEVSLDCIRAAREAAPAEVPLMLDINCHWDTVSQAIGFAQAVQGWNIAWVEEPVWPPEDFAAIAEVRKEGGVPLAAGENCGGVEEFRRMAEASAVDVMQPSVTKVGGIGAVREVAALARKAGLRMVPHCPYYGPGLLASLHILAASEAEEPLEYYFADLAEPPFPALIPQGGFVAVPQGPGLGLEPDPALLAKAT